MPTALFIIAPTNFRDEEFFVPSQILTAAGWGVTVASAQVGECRGKLGGTVTATLALADASASSFDAVVFVGGSGSHVFFDDPAAHQLARATIAAGKILAAICAAPTILARAGVLSGRTATCFPAAEYRAALAAGGAVLSAASVVTDGQIVTADGPAVAADFAAALLARAAAV